MWPNFLVIGAHKAGTSSLAEYLREHPSIYVPELKEARFFAFDCKNPEHLRKGRRIFPVQTESEYLQLFDCVKDEKAVGEASPEYLNSRFAAERIKQFIPQAKLIVSLRNPVDRAYSRYLMSARDAGVGADQFSGWRPDAEELSSGYYYPKLLSYLELFDRSKIKFVLFDDLSRDALSVSQGLYEFLGVDRDYEPDVSVHNKGGLPKSKMLHKILTNRTLVLAARRSIPKRMRMKVNKVKRINMQKAPSLDGDSRNRLVGCFREDILKTQDLIGIELTHWLK